MEVTKATNKRRRRSGRAKKILSPHSRRFLQDLADQDWQLIESSTKRTISELNGVGTVAPHNQILHLLDDGGEEKLAEKLDELKLRLLLSSLFTVAFRMYIRSSEQRCFSRGSCVHKCPKGSSKN